MTNSPAELKGAAADRAMDTRLAQSILPLQERVNDALRAVGDTWNGPAPLPEGMRYALLAGGKRLRPVVVLAACEAAGGNPSNAEAAAVALEMVHSYSLVHDDLPALDNDVLRRGKPTVHVAFGHANAILIGDARLTDSFRLLADDPCLSDRAKVRAVSVLANAAGPNGMVGGQVRDMAADAKGVDELLRLHAEKTGALFVAACRLGATAAGADEAVENALVAYAEAFGEAFQIGDDLVDLLDLDPTAGHEASVNLAAILGPEAAAERVRNAAARTTSALDRLPGPTEPLRAIAAWVIERADDALARTR